ncbi:MAG: hypothetical protein C4523_17020 [Myxococcales bacterium]|nr:MAG: hypothetical protein C4523_17020 [Myxococcales bacterium]
MRLVLIHSDNERYGALARTIAPPLLPVLNKPLAQHQIEEGYDHGLREVTLLATEGIGEIRRHLGDGTRFGVSLDLLIGSLSGDELESLLKHGSLFQEPFIAMAGMTLAHLPMPELAPAHEASGKPISLVRDSTSGADVAAIFSPGGNALLAGQTGRLLEVLRTLADSGHSQIGVVAQPLPHLRGEGLPGLFDVNSHLLRDPSLLVSNLYWENPKGVFRGRGSQIHPRAKVHPPVVIGHYSQVMAGAEIGPDAVIGDETIIDKRATVLRSIVHANSYVGGMTRIENKLAAGDRLFAVGSGAKVVITDPFLLGSIESGPFSYLVDEVVHRGAALALLWALAPFGIAAAIAARRRRGEPVATREVLGAGTIERRDDLNYLPRFQMLTLPETDAPLAWYPGLVNVLKGDMRLVGPRPLSQEEAERSLDDWMLKRFKSQPGLFTLAPFAEDGEHETTIAEMLYAEKRSLALDARIALARALLPFVGKRQARRLIGL